MRFADRQDFASRRSTNCDIAFVGAGWRTTTFIAGNPDLLELDIHVVERADRVGPGAFSDFDVHSASVGARFFQNVRRVDRFGSVLRAPNVSSVANSSSPVALSALASALRSLGDVVANEVGSDRVHLLTEAVRIDIRPGHPGRGALVELSDGSILVARACVLGSGRHERAASELAPFGDRLWLSSAALSVARRGELQELLKGRRPARVAVVGGSHSAFSVLSVLLQLGIQMEVTIFHRGPIRIQYPSVEAAYGDPSLDPELAAIVERSICPSTGIVFRDSGLRHGSQQLYRSVRHGDLPHVRLRRFERLSDVVTLAGDADLVVQATGYTGRFPPLTIEGRPLELPGGRAAIDEDGRVVADRRFGDLPLFALRVEPTPRELRDVADYAAGLSRNLAAALRDELQLAGSGSEHPTLAAGQGRIG